MSESSKEVPLDLVDAPVVAMRESVHDDEIEALVASVRQYGVLEPVLLRPVGERYEIIAGHRRVTASRLAGKVFVPAIVRDVGDEEALMLRLHENSHRENVNPVDEAAYIGTCMHKFGWAVAEMAKRMDRSLGYVYDRLQILDFPEYLLEHVATRKVSISAAAALNKVQDEVTRRNFIEIAAKDGITLERANAWVASVNVGVITPDTTQEQIRAMEQPDVHNETFISCARCERPGKIRDLVTVWIHKQCSPGSGDPVSTPENNA